MRTITPIYALTAICCVGCSKEQVTSTHGHDIADDHTVLVELQGSERTVIIKAGAEGPLYSVIGSGGAFAIRDLTMAELRLRDPELHALVESAIAFNHASAEQMRD